MSGESVPHRHTAVLAASEAGLVSQRLGGRGEKLLRFARSARRQGFSAVGPISVSGAHFIASLMLLRWLPTADFGAFSFVLVACGLCLGLTNALVGAPVSSLAHADSSETSVGLESYAKATLGLAVLLGAAVFGLMTFAGASFSAAIAFAAFGATMSLRQFARIWAYTLGRRRIVVAADAVYSVSLLLGLLALLVAHALSLATSALALFGAAVLALAAFGAPLIALFRAGLARGRLNAYVHAWRDMTRWSLIGVVTTEFTINAHAWLVTFVCGSRAFALLAVGALFMRPFALIATAVPDQERPAMARSIAAGDKEKALKLGREFLAVMGGVWLVTLAFAGIALASFPSLVVKHGYSRNDVLVVVLLWALISAVRGVRARDAVLLQAARAFRPLADASTASCIISVVATLSLLLAFGPVASLAGILAGDIAMLAMIMRAVGRWKTGPTPCGGLAPGQI